MLTKSWIVQIFICKWWEHADHMSVNERKKWHAVPFYMTRHSRFLTYHFTEFVTVKIKVLCIFDILTILIYLTFRRSWGRKSINVVMTKLLYFISVETKYFLHYKYMFSLLLISRYIIISVPCTFFDSFKTSSNFLVICVRVANVIELNNKKSKHNTMPSDLIRSIIDKNELRYTIYTEVHV